MPTPPNSGSEAFDGGNPVDDLPVPVLRANVAVGVGAARRNGDALHKEVGLGRRAITGAVLDEEAVRRSAYGPIGLQRLKWPISHIRLGRGRTPIRQTG